MTRVTTLFFACLLATAAQAEQAQPTKTYTFKFTAEQTAILWNSMCDPQCQQKFGIMVEIQNQLNAQQHQSPEFIAPPAKGKE